MSTGKVLLGVVAGLATGALLGILFAPAKGSDTRKKIAQKTGDAADSVKEKFSEFIDSISSKLSKVKEDVKGHADDQDVKTAQS